LLGLAFTKNGVNWSYNSDYAAAPVEGVASPLPPRNALLWLGGLAEFERRVYPRPHRRGPRASRGARAENGPATKLTPHQRREAIQRRQGDETLADIGRSYNVSVATISRLTE
jgi:hypothetical protein